MRGQEEFAEQAKTFGRYLSGFQPILLIMTAHRLGVFWLIGNKQLTVCDIAEGLKTHPQYTETLLDGLVTVDFLKKEDGKYANISFVSASLLQEGDRSASVYLDFLWQQWQFLPRLEEVVKTGKPLPEMDIFNEGASPLNRYYILIANHYLNSVARELMERLETSTVQRAIVGSAGVTFARALIDKQPQVSITFACLPHCIREVPELIKIYGVRLENVLEMESHTADPEVDRWGERENYDLVFLTRKMGIKPFAEFGKKFMAKSFTVLNRGGMLILWEPIIDEGRVSPKDVAIAAVMDLYTNHGGKVYSERDMRDILTQTGFGKVERVDVAGKATFTVAWR